jgi:hypothetical protein
MKFTDEAVAKATDPSAMNYKLALLLRNQDNVAALDQDSSLKNQFTINLWKKSSNEQRPDD